MKDDLLIVSTEEAIAMCEEALAIFRPLLRKESEMVEEFHLKAIENWSKERDAYEEYMWVRYKVEPRFITHTQLPDRVTNLLRLIVDDLESVVHSCSQTQGQYGFSKGTLSNIEFSEEHRIADYFLSLQELEVDTYYQDKLKELQAEKEKEELAAKEVELLNPIQIKPEGPETIVVNNSNLDKPDDGPPEKVITAVESFLLIGGIIFLVALVAGWFV